ncbi:MAG: hypothetical protein ABI746_12365 [Dermatophilaceae bacterium]
MESPPRGATGRPGARRVAAVALLAVTGLGLGACTGDDGVPPPSSATVSVASTPSPPPTSVATTRAAPAPPGTRLVSDGARKVSFALPQDFTVTDLSVILADPAKKREMTRVFTQLGMPADTIDQLAGQVSFAAFATPTPQGSDTVSITKQSLPRFVTAQEIAAQLATFPDIHVDDTRTVPTSLGEAQRTPFSYTLQGTALSGEFLQVPTPLGLTQVNVTSPGTQTASLLADTLLATWAAS